MYSNFELELNELDSYNNIEFEILSNMYVIVLRLDYVVDLKYKLLLLFGIYVILNIYIYYYEKFFLVYTVYTSLWNLML